MRIVVGISGASGAIIPIKLLENLKDVEKDVIISQNAVKIMKMETGYTVEKLRKSAERIYDNSQMDADIASGTVKFHALVIAPCSTSTLSKIACGIADNLITRVASVALKERRRIILVPRETPLSTVVLRNMYELSKMGAVILPPVPAFYLKPRSVDDIVSYTVGKILDFLGIEHNLYVPYSP
ncbi:MAG: UbiX family flavin prenyltransferase [Thermoplasmata archaeon]|nr:UbiX family flavin prenyltransferase [Thermoplasmata archaeon]